jgi:hypothetical protein
MTHDKTVTTYVTTDEYRISYHSDKQHFELVVLHPGIEGIDQLSFLLPEKIVRQMYGFLPTLDPVDPESVH